MWCKRCGQDVPGISGKRASGIKCARCGHRLTGDWSSSASVAASSFTSVEMLADSGVDLASPKKRPAARPPLPADDWELEDDLRTLERLVAESRSLAAPAARGAANLMHGDPFGGLRHDMSHVGGPTSGGFPSPQDWQRQTAAVPRASLAKASHLAWLCAALGLMAFVCGGSLMVWSVVGVRPALWTLGLPIIVVGQGLLLIGLLLQLERLWHGSRGAATELERMHAELHDLRRATATLGATHSTPAQSFYSHLADGAAPSVLLADLKGQMDLLAARLNR